MISHKPIKQALLIRYVEEKFLELFSEGKLNGTVHTSVGQEFSAVAFAGQLNKNDFIFSNHRCHGHYISFTNNVEGLIAELMGKKAGTCGGVGSSQHLCNHNFFSNGVQGGIIPVAAGYALANKLKNNNNIGIVFIGDGTLGEGSLYETMNLISKWQIPLIIVCENNLYAQSTPQSVNLAGDICKRAEAFGIKTMQSDTWNVDELIHRASEAINFVRTELKPLFVKVDTYRLNAHSKGDDDRDVNEIKAYKEKDYLNQFAKNDPIVYKRFIEAIVKEVDQLVEYFLNQPELTLNEYYKPDQITESLTWVEPEDINVRQVQLINKFFNELMAENDKIVFVGEDVLSPYGGAFKVAKDLSNKFPKRVFSTSISESAIVGISNGLALAGFKPFAEIMFGDFITLAFDQIVNHAAKFHHMYNGKANCPVVIRTPMGGHRGYGPTHSQTLDKFLIGIDYVKTIALNTIVNPEIIYRSILTENKPIIVIENKTDYGRKLVKKPIKNYKYLQSNQPYPVVKISPVISNPSITLVTYGGISNIVIDCIERIFQETELKPEVIILSQISPLQINPILESVIITRTLFVIEEGSTVGGIGSEIIATITEQIHEPILAARIGALPVPIPSVKSLEDQVLPNADRIIQTIRQYTNQ